MLRSLLKAVLLSGAGAGLLLGSSMAMAQPAKGGPRRGDMPKKGEVPDIKKEEKREEEAPKVKVERGAGGKKVYVIKTGFVIEGRIQKPNAFYVLQRSQINYDWAALKQDFVPKILDSVRKSPF